MKKSFGVITYSEVAAMLYGLIIQKANEIKNIILFKNSMILNFHPIDAAIKGDGASIKLRHIITKMSDNYYFIAGGVSVTQYEFMREFKENGLRINLENINHSDYHLTVVENLGRLQPNEIMPAQILIYSIIRGIIQKFKNAKPLVNKFNVDKFVASYKKTVGESELIIPELVLGIASKAFDYFTRRFYKDPSMANIEFLRDAIA